MVFDEGYQYGIGGFETIAVHKGNAIFIKEHLDRLNKTLSFLDITQVITKEDLLPFLHKETMDSYAMKILVSQKNFMIKKRELPYTTTHYHRGFHMEFSTIKRNNTSPFVFHKTLNYGECIIEKRRAHQINLDEILFLNFNNEVCEGTACNIFFVKNRQIFTPKLSCGLLSGIIRGYICNTFDVTETLILPSQIPEFDECFVTNSLMGIMPVYRLENTVFLKKEMTKSIANDYFCNILHVCNPIL